MAISPPLTFSAAFARARTAEKFVNNRPANLLGCQAIRAASAAFLLAMRRRRLPAADAHSRMLLEDGIVTIPEYLDAATFAALREEVARGVQAIDRAPPPPDKFGIVRNQIGLQKHPGLFPIACRTLLEDKHLLGLVGLSEGWPASDAFADSGLAFKYERLEQLIPPAVVPAGRDGEKSTGDLHSDTFHVVTKVFFLLSPMTEENSPFTYCVGTQRLRARLWWEYKNSIRREQYAREGGKFQRRMSAEEISRRGLSPKAITAGPNTLIVADTCGFHLRGRMTRQGAVREMLRMDFRSNPFRA